MDADVIVIGAGLAGLVAAAEIADSGRKVIVVEQEPETSCGGQAYWSFGGLFLVDSPEQRRLGIKDSSALAWQDWEGTAGFDREEDHWPRKWAEAYVEFAAGEKRRWLHRQGMRFFPVVGWAERGGYGAAGPGNSVPRFHIVWGTGPGVIEPFLRRVQRAAADGRVEFRFRHRVDNLTINDRVVSGVQGTVLATSPTARGAASSREAIGDFELSAQAVLVAAGGIGGNHELVRAAWPKRLGEAPGSMITGVPRHVDGRMLGIAVEAGANLINGDRMWHYVEGIKNHSPVWADHGIRILPGPSSLWLDGNGRRLPAPLYPGFDTLGTLQHLRKTGHDHSWFVTTAKIVEKEFALSGSEQNPDLTGRDIGLTLGRIKPGPTAPVQAFLERGEDFVSAATIDELVRKMNELTPDAPVDAETVRREVYARDNEIVNTFSKDPQVTALRGARNYIGDKLIRVARPHRLQDPKAGPLIAVRLHIITRKTLGGLQTNLEGQVLAADGTAIPGLYAAGEASGFGGGGMHGYRSLEGTFLGGCIFSGREAGRGVAKGVR
ncbi:FAD-binding dehydrogenase [Saxibacter everestensis]|uniref:FAD-binding dehydrogenase n=1 Tax=Saxibacter everestensis TaxID=2909229 RepID=A0ABY8QUE4_9MICO|nr:FAD-binding dehydrogenase [Brevibacteriaceae bacterium ZFBP1038]